MSKFLLCLAISATVSAPSHAGIITPAHDGEKVVFENENLPNGEKHPSLEKGGKGDERSGNNSGAWEAHKKSPVLDYQSGDDDE